MATTKRRLNITLTPEIEEVIKFLAQKDKVPEATKISELLKNAIEIEEDAFLLEIAKKRDIGNIKYIEKNKFWKNLGI